MFDDNDPPLSVYDKLADAHARIKKQLRYIAELEKQLEYQQPGIVKEVQEFLQYQDEESPFL